MASTAFETMQSFHYCFRTPFNYVLSHINSMIMRRIPCNMPTPCDAVQCYTTSPSSLLYSTLILIWPKDELSVSALRCSLNFKGIHQSLLRHAKLALGRGPAVRQGRRVSHAHIMLIGFIFWDESLISSPMTDCQPGVDELRLTKPQPELGCARELWICSWIFWTS